MLVRNTYDLIGYTPLMYLSMETPNDANIHTKLEVFNSGGSIRDRLRMTLIQRGTEEGKIKDTTTITESTAGNTGIGVALAALEYHLPVKLMVPGKFSFEKQILIRALGVEVIDTPSEEGIKGAIVAAKELAAEIGDAYMPLQLQNPANLDVYQRTLGPEILAGLVSKPLVAFIAGAGSGGTFAGIQKVLQDAYPELKGYTVEPAGPILNGGLAYSHRTEGIGVEFIPPSFKDLDYTGVKTISDEDAFYYVCWVAKNLGPFIGSSSGVALVASLEVAKELPHGANLVMVFPDSSERYLSEHIYEE